MENVNNAVDKVLGQMLREIDSSYSRIMALSESLDIWRYAVIDAEWAKIDSCVQWIVDRNRLSDFNRRMTPDMIRAMLKGGA